MKSIYLSVLFFLFNFCIYSQEKPLDDYTGIAVSPSSMHLSIKPGETFTKQITITNDTKKKYNFQLTFQDFDMNVKGKPAYQGAEKYSLSKYITISPSYIEIAPGEQKKVNLIISIPDEDEAYVAMWTIVVIDEVLDRAPLDVEEAPDKMAFGVTTTVGFGVYIYQNPPNVKINKMEIDTFYHNVDSNNVKMIVRNVGDGISYSVSYVELTNINTGKQIRLPSIKFTILPQHLRNFEFKLPKDLEKGKYSVIGVLDYGSKEEIIAAELEFEIP